MPIVTYLWTNDRSWKDRFLFVRGELVWGPHRPGSMFGHWKAVYELMLKEGMRFPIPRLIRDKCDHYKIAPSQLMLNE